MSEWVRRLVRTGSEPVVVSEPEPVAHIYLFNGINRVNNVFLYGLYKIAGSEAKLNSLGNIISTESGFKADAANVQKGRLFAAGLIQIIRPIAPRFGTTVEAILKMSAVEQLPLIKRFYPTPARIPDDPGTAYMMNIVPLYSNKSDDTKIGEVGNHATVPGTGFSYHNLYVQNSPKGDPQPYSAFDGDKDYIITVGDVKNFARAKFNAAKARGSIPVYPEELPSGGGGLGTAAVIGVLIALGAISYRVLR